MADDDIYTIESDIPEMRAPDAYLSSYRAYRGSQDGSNGVPLGTLTRPKPYLDPASTMTSENSFIQYRPSSHRVITLVAAFLCCCPVGIAALIYSCRAQCAKKEGKFGKAALLGKWARDLAVSSIVLGISLLLVGLLVLIITFVPGIRG